MPRIYNKIIFTLRVTEPVLAIPAIAAVDRHHLASTLAIRVAYDAVGRYPDDTGLGRWRQDELRTPMLTMVMPIEIGMGSCGACHQGDGNKCNELVHEGLL